MKIKLTLLLLVSILTTSTSYAFGNHKDNGGDLCENRIQNIRNDIESWIYKSQIYKGGPAKLEFPSGITLEKYNREMLIAISQAKINCTDEKILVAGAEKSCRNYQDESGNIWIECNLDRFESESESDQYVLIHHEYAGVAGFETNHDEESDYRLSNQISAFLENQVVKKLALFPSSNYSKLPSGSQVKGFIDDEDNYGCMLQYFQLRAYGNRTVESEMKEQCQSGEIKNVIKTYFRAIYGRDARCYISAIGVEVNAKAICK